MHTFLILIYFNCTNFKICCEFIYEKLDFEVNLAVDNFFLTRSLNSDIRAKLVRLLAAGALRNDFWSFLQMDRKDRHLMKYPNDFENLTVEVQGRRGGGNL